MPSPIDSWQDAERAAREALIDMGFSGVALTSSGSDGGVDVKADGLVAQVKAYIRAASVGPKSIAAGLHRLRTPPGSFSLAPYTNEAFGLKRPSRSSTVRRRFLQTRQPGCDRGKPARGPFGYFKGSGTTGALWDLNDLPIRRADCFDSIPRVPNRPI